MRLTAFALALVTIIGCSSERGTESMSAAEFESFVREVFMPIYPILAEQIIDDTMISSGRCLDVGAGGGHLSIEVARMSTLSIDCTDLNPDAVDIARANVDSAGLADRITCAVADVQQLPYADATFDLVISRGSFLFWDDKVKGFAEIHRVLKPEGRAYIGGGMGRRMPLAVLQNIKAEMKARNVGPGVDPISDEEMAAILREAGIDDFNIFADRADGNSCRCSMWVAFGHQ